MEAVIASLKSCAGVALARLRAVGFRLAVHLPVLLDADGAAIRPAIPRSDHCSTVEVAGLEASHAAHFRLVTHNGLSCTWTLSQLMGLPRTSLPRWRGR